MQTARQPAQPGERRNPAHAGAFKPQPAVTIMPFADAEEERLWVEIAERRNL